MLGAAIGEDDRPVGAEFVGFDEQEIHAGRLQIHRGREQGAECNLPWGVRRN